MPGIISKPLSYYVDLLNNNIDFSIARYFDGEWNIITGRRELPHRTGGGHLYFPKLKKDLYDSVVSSHLHEHYYYGTWYRITSGDYTSQFCIKHNLKIKWYDGYIFHSSLMEGKIFPFIEALRKRKVIFIGPDSLRCTEKLFPIEHYVSIIERDCYMQKEDMIERTVNVAFPGAVVLVHASLAGKVVVYELYKVLQNDCTIIDTGSIWNIFCENSRMRGWWRKLKDNNPEKFQSIYNSNLGLNPDGSVRNS
jgi:hypothetical protein